MVEIDFVAAFSRPTFERGVSFGVLKEHKPKASLVLSGEAPSSGINIALKVLLTDIRLPRISRFAYETFSRKLRRGKW